MRRRLRRIAPRLIVALTLLVAAVEGVFGWVNVTTQERQLVGEVVTGADQLSRSVTSATWHAMRADRRKDAYEVMQTIAEKQGVARIRILNKQGVVAYSTAADTGSKVDKKSEACAVCHADGKPLLRPDAPSRARIWRGLDGRRRMGMVTAIYNEPACGVSGCHPGPGEQAVLGVLDVSLDLAHVDAEVSEITTRAILMAGVHIVLLAAFIAFFTSRFVTRPLRKVIAATRAVSATDLGKPLELDDATELADLQDSFNLMRDRLEAALAELRSIREGLEHEVEERSAQLQRARDKLIQSDRMATLGQLCASVAHEINNPVSGVLNLSMVLQRLLREDGVPPARVQEFRRYLQQVSDETARIGRTVSDLLAFSRRSAPQRVPADLNAIVEKTISLVSHKLALAKAEVRTELAQGLPLVPCDRSQVEQVVLNLLMNAAEAMPSGGRIVVRTRGEEPPGVAVLEVEDQGTGIPQEHLSRIFDPFFTTKDAGKGVGLGLTVVYGIVDAHGGSVDVRSAVGAGTTFTVRLPLKQAVAREPAAAAPRPSEAPRSSEARP